MSGTSGVKGKKKEIVIVCPNCKSQCFGIKMEQKLDGNNWTEDTCWNCGEKLPTVCLK